MSILFVLINSLLFLIYTYLRLNFNQLKSFVTQKDLMVSNKLMLVQSSKNYISFMILSITFFCAIILYRFNVIAQIGPLYSIEVSYICFLLGVSMLVSYLFSKLAQYNMEIWLALLSLTGAIIWFTQNLMQVYIIVEILAYLSMLLLVMQLQVSSLDRQYSFITALIFTFIFNFFSSIIFFSLIIYVDWSLDYSTWKNIIFCDNSSALAILGAILIGLKFGTGPWALSSVYTYIGYSLPYLLIYTLTSMVTWAPILLLLDVNGLIVYSFIILLLIIVQQHIVNLTSLKQLFALSTSILYAYLLLITI